MPCDIRDQWHRLVREGLKAANYGEPHKAAALLSGAAESLLSNCSTPQGYKVPEKGSFDGIF